MLQIGNCEQEWIVEDATRKVERYSVLVCICSSLYFIPLELKLAVIQPLLFLSVATECRNEARVPSGCRGQSGAMSDGILGNAGGCGNAESISY
jgi:hypothetical protein